MTFGNFFPKVGTWLASSAHLFVRWFLKIVSMFLPNNKLALTANDTTAAGGISLPGIRQEGKKFIQYASGSLVESLIAIGAIFESIPAGKCAEIFGRKNVIVCLTISFVFSWTTIYFSNDVWMVYVARLITGSVIFTFASSQLVDRAGQRVLWQISDFVMATCLGTLAFYFWLQEHGVDVSSFKLIPFISLGLYVSTFTLGLDPTLCVMIGKSFSPEFKGLAIGILCVLNSLIEFCVVNTHQMLVDVEALNRRFAPVFPPSGVLDSPAPREVAVADATTDVRLGAISIGLDFTKMTFGNSFPKVGTWLASSAHLFVRWFLKIVSIFLPNNKPAVKKPLLAVSPPPKNDTTAAGGIALPGIRQEGNKFIQYASGSWVESLIAIGAIFRSIPAGKCAEIFGRKNVVVCLTISFVFSWTTIYFSNDVWMVYVARLIVGSVIFTFASTQLVDRAGRRALWQISDFVMATCLGTLAFYFWLQEHSVDVSSFKLIPFISLGLYVSTFALGLSPTLGVMIGKSFSPVFKDLATGILCVLDSLIEFCVVKTYQMLTNVEAVKRRFTVVFQPSVVMDSPATREVTVADATTDARLGALEDAVRSLLVADANRSIVARLDALEDAVRSLSGQLAALAANREPTDQQARTRTPSTWCYYHTRYGKDARKCGSVLCTFAPKKLNQNQPFKKSHV